MAKKEDVREKVKRKIKEFREKKDKTVGEVKIPGVSKPKKKDPKEKNEEAKRKQHKQAVVVGPRGGKYVETRTGKKQYKQKEKIIKSILAEIESTKITDFVKEFKKGKNNE